MRIERLALRLWVGLFMLAALPVAAAAATCDANPGAPAGSPTLGPTTYSGSGTTTVANVIFDGNHVDDLVRAYGGHVIFDHVTFRDTGTGDTGHALEVKQGGSVEVRNSRFEGRPAEDHIQFENNDPSIVTCNVFVTAPGEDHNDFKNGATVRIEDNTYLVEATGGRTIQNANSTGRVELHRNVGMENVFYEDNASGEIVGNEITQLDLYDMTNVLVDGNIIGGVKHGEWGTGRVPVATYFENNVIGDAVTNGGTCYRDGNTGADPVPFCISGPPSWYDPTAVRVLHDGFDAGLIWQKSGSVDRQTGSPKVGTHSVRLRQTGQITRTISLLGYADVSVSFMMGAKSLDNANEKVQAHYWNGSGWVLLAEILNGSSRENGRLHTFEADLPQGVDGLATFALRFRILGSGLQDYGFVDEVAIHGRPQ